MNNDNKGWKKVRLGDVCNFRRGYDLTKHEMIVGNIPVAGSNGIIGYHNIASNISPCITIGRSGNIGKPYYYEKCWAHNTVLYIDDFKENNPKYIYYLLKSIDLSSYSSGSAVPTLNRNHIHPLEILHNSNSITQQKIASILGSLDDKIELNNRMNANLEEQAQALFKRWFVDKKESLNYTKLGDVVNTTSGGTPSRSNLSYYENGVIRWVKSKELQGSFIIETEEKITTTALKESSAKLIPTNSILIAMYGATVGEFGIIASEMTCNQAICALIPNDKYPASFLFMFVKNKKEELKNLAIGSAQQNISQILIKDLQVPCCSGLISQYDNIVKPYFERIRTNQQESQTLAQLRDTLLPKLMSGEVEV
ncbi:MAG: restriction endonuclease subunit S [Bacteroidales bacterium]